MSRPSHKQAILINGLRVIHTRGFSNASVRDITSAANVPNGSFTNHFASKEAFGLAVLNLYVEDSAALMEETLLNEARKPIERVLAYVDACIAGLEHHGVAHGCMIGNMGNEIGPQSELIRERVAEVFRYRCAVMAQCIKAAIAAGDMAQANQADDVGGFIVGSLQGATLLAKSQQSMEPMKQFRRVLVSSILR